jgi:hypothetical protein
MWHFVSVRRTADAINEALEAAYLEFVDKPFSRANLKFMIEGGRAFLRTMEREGAILPGSDVWLLDTNSDEDMAQGIVKLGVKFDPQVIALFGLAVGQEREFMASGALVHEDGTVINATAYIRGRLNKTDHGAWKTGEVGENDFAISLRYYKLEVEGQVIIEADPFSVSIGGTSQTAAIRAALLV